VLSSSTDSTIDGVPYLDGDLIAWDPATNAAGLFLSEALFGGSDEDIDAVHVLGDGSILLSTTSGAALGGLGFASGDVVRYDPGADTADMVFDGSDWFDASENINALSVMADGSLLISSSTDGTAGALAFLDGDVLRFDGEGLSLWLSEAAFGGTNEDVDALHVVPAPAAVLSPGSSGLLLLGLAGLLVSGRVAR